ncbi:hypothetical protein KSAC_33680 (plasmid) [Komagataeibacter saccharivorans]|nr:hypothetical protein KSAC_33680 [Komagataeibacter saccharivorans]
MESSRTTPSARPISVPGMSERQGTAFHPPLRIASAERRMLPDADDSFSRAVVALSVSLLSACFLTDVPSAVFKNYISFRKS